MYHTACHSPLPCSCKVNTAGYWCWLSWTVTGSIALVGWHALEASGQLQRTLLPCALCSASCCCYACLAVCFCACIMASAFCCLLR